MGVWKTRSFRCVFWLTCFQPFRDEFWISKLIANVSVIVAIPFLDDYRYKILSKSDVCFWSKIDMLGGQSAPGNNKRGAGTIPALL